MKNKVFGHIILGILFVFLTIIAFVVPIAKTRTFWITYVFTAIAFLLQIPMWDKVLSQKNTLKSKFLGIPIVHIGSVYLILQIVVFIMVMAVPVLPTWVAIVVCLIVLGVSVVCMISIEIGVGEINRVEEKVQEKVSFIKRLQVDVKLLADTETDSETKALLKQLAEKISYSDPMSHADLTDIETTITDKIIELKTVPDKKPIITEVLLLVAERNQKAKILK